MKKNQVEIQHIDRTIGCPIDSDFQLWVDTALEEIPEVKEVVIRIVDELESADLNYRYRQKQGATNILSFPADFPKSYEIPLLGDLVVCAPVIAQQAKQQKKALNDHWAHIVIHGVLHLLGYDHEEELDAETMEQKEIKLLQALGIEDPYREVID